MNINSEKTVWINIESDRYFIIPDDKQPGEGSFELSTIDRMKRSVVEVDVSGYEVTEEAAHQWLQFQVNEQMNRAKEAVKQAFADRRKEAESKEPEPAGGFTEGNSTVSPTLTLATEAKGTYDSLNSFVGAPQEATYTPSSNGSNTGADVDDVLTEAVSILNKAVNEIQLTAARAVADLQEVKEKMASNMT